MTDIILQHISSVTGQYLAALLAQPAVATVPIAGEKSAPVEQVYVKRTLLQEVVQKRSDRVAESGTRRGAPDTDADHEITVKLPVDLWLKLRTERVVLIEGPAGMGKSTLSKQLVRESAAQQKLIPIWIACRDWIGSRLTLPEYLEQHYVPRLGLSGECVPYKATGEGPDRSLGQWLYEQWVSGLGVLMLDGLDELFVHHERVAALQALPITGTGPTRPTTILTSRPLSQALPLTFTTIELQGLMPPEQTHLIDRYRGTLQLSEEQTSGFQREVEQNTQGRVLELLTRPGHLVQILSTYARTGILPTTETEVFEELLQSRLMITGRSEPSIDPEDPSKKQQMLGSLALHFLACRQGQRHTRAQLLALIRQVLREQGKHGQPLFPLALATALLNDFIRNSGLLTEVEPEVYTFETVIWLQHLTGAALANANTIASLKLTNKQVLDFLDKKAWDPEWEPVLKSWVGNTQDPVPFLRSLTDAKCDDFARHRLGAAARCLKENKPVRRGEGVTGWCLEMLRLFFRGDILCRRLNEQILTESYRAWMTYAQLGIEALIEVSLRGAWIEMEGGQARLRRILAHQNEQIGKRAAKALGLLGPTMPVGVQATLMAKLEEEALLSEDFNEVAREIRVALGKVGTGLSPTVQDVLEGWLKGKDKRKRDAAEKVCEELGAGMPAALQKALVVRLNGPFAAAALGKVVSNLSPSVQASLMTRLNDTDAPEVRMWAAVTLGHMGGNMLLTAQEAVVSKLKDEDHNVREQAVKALGQLGSRMSPNAQAALVALFEHEEEEIWRANATSLMASTEEYKDGRERDQVALMNKLMREQLVRIEAGKERVCTAAVEALGNLGVAMPDFIQATLVARLEVEAISGKGSYGTMAEKIEVALGKVGCGLSPTVQGVLEGWLKDKDKRKREVAAKACEGLGAGMPAALQSALVLMLEDRARRARGSAVRALAGMGEAMPEVVKVKLIAELKNNHSSRRWDALRELMEIRENFPPDVLEALLVETQARLEDTDWEKRLSALKTLWKLKALLLPTVQAGLVARLRDARDEVRTVAAQVCASAQQQGLRYFLDGVSLSGVRHISDLSVAAPFADTCIQPSNRPRHFLATS